MTRRAEALMRSCPTCGAFAGQPCAGRGGVRSSVHVARFTGEKPMVTRRPTGGLLTEQELIEQEIMSTVRWHEEHLRMMVTNAVKAGESPIERVFIAALVAIDDARELGEPVHIYAGRRSGLPSSPFPGLHIYSQVPVDGYRLDFLALHDDGATVRYTIIELDGHDYHERTKAQASHDKKRDRHFTKKGWQVLRYTGSDVWKSPSACAREAIYTAIGIGDQA